MCLLCLKESLLCRREISRGGRRGEEWRAPPACFDSGSLTDMCELGVNEMLMEDNGVGVLG